MNAGTLSVLEELLIFDYIGWFFWTLTYIVIIITGVINKKSKNVGIPVMPVIVNFSWEIASVINPTTICRKIWFFFDIFIVALIFKKQDLIKNRKRLVSYLVFLIACTVAFFYIFKSESLILPISSFFIDTVMAIVFLVQRKKIEPANRLIIGICKLLGDAFVWVYHAGFHISVSWLAGITLICNIIYVVYAIKEKKENPDIRNEFYKGLKDFFEPFKRKKPSYPHNNYKKKQRNKKTHRKK